MTADEEAGRYVRDGIPPFVEVYDRILDLVRKLDPGALLPGEVALTAELGFARGLVHEALLLLEEDGKLVRERDRLWRVAPMAEPAAFTDSFHRMLGGRARPVRRLLVGIEDGSHWSHELLRGETQVLVWETVFEHDDVLLASTLEMMALAAAPPELTEALDPEKHDLTAWPTMLEALGPERRAGLTPQLWRISPISRSTERLTWMELPLHGIPAALTVVLAEDGAPVYLAKNILDLGTFDLVVDQLGPRHVSDLDLVVADATLRGREGRWRIGIDADRIAVVTRDAIGGREEVDAAGALVTESFVNGHLHLDKVHTLDRVGDAALTAYTAGDMGSALTSIELASAVKADYDRAWIEPNARRAVLEAVRHGVRHVLAFADVDTKARLEGVIPLLALREEFRGVVDLQVVAFPQDGLLCDPGAEELVREAVDLGADVVGGIPWIEHTDADAREHVQRMCALAAAQGRRVAMLVDDAGDASLRTTEMLATAMVEHGLVGRGVANHARAIGLYARPTLERLVGLARRAGLGFVSDPHTGSLHLPVRELTAMGIPVALGQDDIEDAYYPFGRHNMVEVAFLAAHALGAFDQPGLDLVYDAVTTTAADVLGVPGHRLEPGGNADLVVHHHTGLREVLAHHAPPAHVVASGKVVASSGSSTTFRPI